MMIFERMYTDAHKLKLYILAFVQLNVFFRWRKTTPSITNNERANIRRTESTGSCLYTNRNEKKWNFQHTKGRSHISFFFNNDRKTEENDYSAEKANERRVAKTSSETIKRRTVNSCEPSASDKGAFNS